MTADVSVDALERLLAEQVPCAAPGCPQPAVWRGEVLHMARLPVLCEAATVCDAHRREVEDDDDQHDARMRRTRRYPVCVTHGWRVRPHATWRAL